jgi:hypothetical protein
VTTTAVVEPDPVEVEARARARINELRTQRRAKSPEALHDEAVAAEVASIDQEIEQMQSLARRAVEACAEREQRDADEAARALADELAKVQQARASLRTKLRKSAERGDSMISALYEWQAADEKLIDEDAKLHDREVELIAAGANGSPMPTLLAAGELQRAFEFWAPTPAAYNHVGFASGQPGSRSLAEQRGEN